MGSSEDVRVDFDRFHSDYDEALERGLSASGEGRLYFARGRVAFLARCLREAGVPPPESVLDFGCGTGAATPFLLEDLGARRLVGVDVSERSLEVARGAHGSDRARFVALRDYSPSGDFALVFCNGVFHHVPPPERDELAALLGRSLEPGGHFALWENNPWNPGTRYIMSRIAFDREAITLSAPEAARLAPAAGLVVVRTDYLFIFPRFLRALRFLEPRLSKAPLGGQYQVLFRRQLERPTSSQPPPPSRTSVQEASSKR